MRKVLGTIAATAALVTSGVVLAPAASAAPAPGATAGFGCSGSQINSYPVKTPGGAQYATIHLYYDSATGRNCASTVATAAGGYGTTAETAVHITACSGTTLSSCMNTSGSTDIGNYQYYAGPVSVQAAGRCILVSGWRKYNGATAAVQRGPVHCG
ncbi:hypothetical protein ACH4E8_15140 [Streptomyces sp. NPDC017979]|uniref:hypothetical protein n=1 Tax=Streptomyces sp. NPDC017979 TaxID=3365024 RepID=UPI0037A7B33C